MPIRIADIHRTVDGRRVEAFIDGLPIWFESDDVALTPAAEAFTSALLIPGLSKGRSLAIERPIDPVWLTGAPGAVRLAAEWFGFSPVDVSVGPTTSLSERRSKAALCFSGGVDSFHALLTEDFDAIVQVQGFDMRLDDPDRLADAEADARHVAREHGIDCIVVRTNLRSHPTFGAVSWELSHGGALAAVGHLLVGTIGSLGISSSSPRGTPGSWGSDYRLDRLWSSSRLSVGSVAIDAARIDKVAVVAEDALARDHLRVCWEHRTSAPNCSTCEKCIRTMVALATVGRLDDTPRLDGSLLVASIDALGPLSSSVLRDEYAAMLSRGLPGDVARAVGDLVERNQHVGLRWGLSET